MKAFLKAVWQLTLSTASATRQTISELSLLSLLWKLWSIAAMVSRGTGQEEMACRLSCISSARCGRGQTREV